MNNQVRLKQTGEDQYMLIINGHHLENGCEVTKGGTAMMIPINSFIDVAELGSSPEPFEGPDGTDIMLTIGTEKFIFSEEIACQVYDVAESCLWTTVENVTDNIEDWEVIENDEGDLEKAAPQPKLVLV
jgi:hypothetical protein